MNLSHVSARILVRASILCALVVVACSAAGKRDAHVVVDRVEAACVVIARSLDPGAEVLCATAAELTDAIIEMTRKKQGIAAMATPYDPEDARLELFETVKARRAAGAVVEPKK